MTTVDLTTLDLASLKTDLKSLIVVECDKDIEPGSIDDDAILIGGDLDLDSLDALQISMAVKNRYGVRCYGNEPGLLSGCRDRYPSWDRHGRTTGCTAARAPATTAS